MGYHPLTSPGMFSRRILRTKVMQTLYAFFVQTQNGLSSTQATKVLKESLHGDIRELQMLHSTLLQTICVWSRLDATYEETFNMPHQRSFAQNTFVQQLDEHPVFIIQSKRYPSPWSREQVAQWYYDKLAPAPFFQTYKNVKIADALRDLACIKRMFKQIIFLDHEIMNEIEHIVLSWEIYKEAFITEMQHFLKIFATSDDNAFVLYEESFGGEGVSFYTMLIDRFLQNHTLYEEWIRKQSENWAYDRMPLLDCVLLKMALTEAASLKHAPKAVIINEYVELAKKYSTENSYRFVHGILDVLLKKRQV